MLHTERPLLIIGLVVISQHNTGRHNMEKTREEEGREEMRREEGRNKGVGSETKLVHDQYEGIYH